MSKEVEFWSLKAGQEFIYDGKRHKKIDMNFAEELEPSTGKPRPLSFPENTLVLVEG